MPKYDCLRKIMDPNLKVDKPDWKDCRTCDGSNSEDNRKCKGFLSSIKSTGTGTKKGEVKPPPSKPSDPGRHP